MQATLVGSSEGSGRWSQLGEFGVIKEEDEDGTETVSSEKTNMEKCEKDSGVGRNDESSEQDVADETATTSDGVKKYGRTSQQKEANLTTQNSGANGSSSEKLQSQGKSDKGCEGDRNADHSKRHRRSKTRGDSPGHSGGSPKHMGDSTKRAGDSSSRKSKSKGKAERKKSRESSKDFQAEDLRHEREQSRHSVQLRSRRNGNFDRSVRASYIRACNKDSIRHINLIGNNGYGEESEYDNVKSDHHKRRAPSLKDFGALKDAQAMENFHQSMEWRVRVTKDGSQIFVQKKDPMDRRQARNKLLRERAQKISEERKGLTTDDDTHSVYQGRYWPRESRRRQLEKVREARKQRSHRSQQVQRVLDSGSDTGKRDIVEMSQRKLNKRRERFDDFVTVQEILRQRNPGGVPSGPIHVTTV